MFSVVSVCHVTITHDALDFTIQGPPPKHGTSLYRDPQTWDLTVQGPPSAMAQPHSTLDMGPHCMGTLWPQCPLLVTSGGQDWRLVQTCSPEDPPWC